MSSVNVGNQTITWKYSTPLRADYINTMLSNISSEGLCVRPSIAVTSGANAKVTINPFSMLVHPDDDISSYVDAEGKPFSSKLVKITTTEPYTMAISEVIIAIGFKYSFSNKGVQLTQWYGEFQALSLSEIANFEGIIIATVIFHQRGDFSKYFVSTSGADISDALLEYEGWDPNHWLSLISPRRLTADNYKYDRFEIRSHNDAYSGYVNGYKGFSLHKNLMIQLDKYAENVPNDYGIMAKKYNLVQHDSSGMSLAEASDTLPIEETSGSVIAVLDCSETNSDNLVSAFTNNIKVKPCMLENVNVFVKGNTVFFK